jgi:hypothetical protein
MSKKLILQQETVRNLTRYEDSFLNTTVPICPTGGPPNNAAVD